MRRRRTSTPSQRESLLNVNPNSVRAYLKLAEIASQQGQDGQVRDLLGQAIKQVPQDPAAHLALARYLASRKDLVGAINVTNAFLKKAQPQQ